MIQCTSCSAAIPTEAHNTGYFHACVSCKSLIRVDVFPAMFREKPKGSSGEAVLLENEAACFYHPGKKASIVCDSCGRFLCDLCDVAFNHSHLCPVCLETGKKKRKIKTLENHRVLFDSMVLYLAIVPIVFVWATFVTAPAAIFLAIRHWKAPSSIIPRTKIRLILALLIAGIQTGTWVTLIFFWAAS